jgi:hypothetical protein
VRRVDHGRLFVRHAAVEYSAQLYAAGASVPDIPRRMRHRSLRVISASGGSDNPATIVTAAVFCVPVGLRRSRRSDQFMSISPPQ